MLEITQRQTFSDYARSWLIVTGSLVLAACGSMVRDGGPDRHVDISDVQNPVPRVEARSKYGNPPSYVVAGQRYYVKDSASGYYEEGIASWYGTKFHGERTSSGETYDMYAMTAAHKTLPIPVYAEVTNLNTGNKIIVRINDRGPFVKGRIIDLSYVAAKKLGIASHGTGRVSVRTINPRIEPRQTPPTPAPQLTAANMPAKAIPAPASTEPGGLIYLQVGAFSEHHNATQLMQQLLTATRENVHINRKSAGQYDLYRVRIGPLQNEADVQRLRTQLSEAGMPDPHLVVE